MMSLYLYLANFKDKMASNVRIDPPKVERRPLKPRSICWVDTWSTTLTSLGFPQASVRNFPITSQTRIHLLEPVTPEPSVRCRLTYYIWWVRYIIAPTKTGFVRARHTETRPLPAGVNANVYSVSPNFNGNETGFWQGMWVRVRSWQWEKLFMSLRLHLRWRCVRVGVWVRALVSECARWCLSVHVSSM